MGYFSLCVRSLQGLDCIPTSGATTASLVQRYTNSASNGTKVNNELKQLFSWALMVQKNILPPLISVGSAMFVVGVFGLIELKRRIWFKNNISTQTQGRLRGPSLGMVLASVVFILIATVSTEMTTMGMQSITQNLNTSTIIVTGGSTLIVLQWLAFTLSAIFAIGVFLTTRTGETSMNFNKLKNGGSSGSKNSAQEPRPTPPALFSTRPAPPPSGGPGGSRPGPPPPPPPPPPPGAARASRPPPPPSN
ncbi:hypothetical protein BJ875DRAFT_446296 [Amylocarpus encephaloides]|uniref:Uncharacterized protein n=1 Tax=Amylocarpus encephaloides TaxID=45428 RepID=A0A9P8C067_9HELO|nr:hypothetical protein BJ875DRAFT_446296 [Amylocarpus encephaloides]